MIAITTRTTSIRINQKSSVQGFICCNSCTN